MKDTFISKASDWDSPERISMTKKFVDELLMHVSPLSTWKALEIGAGTGLIGLQIEPFVSKVVFEDTSESMLNVLKQKLNDDIKAEILHGEVFEYKQRDIDLIFSSMAFHHITNIEKTLQHLAMITKTGAWVVVGDLETEDGSFHGFEPVPHLGFDTSILSEQFRQNGFDVKSVNIYNTISKRIDSITMNYEQFILIAQRK